MKTPRWLTAARGFCLMPIETALQLQARQEALSLLLFVGLMFFALQGVLEVADTFA